MTVIQPAYRRLGQSGLLVFPIGLGTMMFGAQTNQTEASRIVDVARDVGVNLIDTADVYADGESERIVGALIARDRQRWLVETKVGSTRGTEVNQGGLSKHWIHRALEASLKRLDMDYIDIYVLHRDDRDTPLEETIGAIGHLIQSGRIRYFGVSNYQAWRIAAVVEACRRMGIPDPIVCQPHYNAVNRMAEVEILPACSAYGLGVTPYSPLARGVLTGKYQPQHPPEKTSRAGRGDRRILETEFRDQSLLIAGKFRIFAEKRGMTASQYAINWILNNRIVSAALAGPRTLDQWTEYVRALDFSFDPEDEALVDQLVPPGHPSTPGFTDPRHPVTGRQPLVS